MGKIKDWINNRRLKRLESDLRIMRNKINFDPRYAFGVLDTGTSEAYTRRIEEYRIWSMGNARLLRRLYNREFGLDTINYFWRKAPVTSRMVHCGIPGLISATMATVLFGNGVDLSVTVYGEDGKESEKASKEAKELIDNLYDIIGMSELLERGATEESWGGHIFYKFSHDITLSLYPILEVADIRNAEAVKERGITTAIIFKKWYKHNSEAYRLNEIYSTDESGDATIQYLLYKLEGDREREVSLTSIPETSQIAEEMGLDETNTFTYTGIKGMLAFDKPNKTPSLEFPNSIYGASDYEGAIDSFDALDETYSKIFHELRTNRTIRYLPDNMIPTEDGKAVWEDDFTDAYVRVSGDADQDAENKIEITQIADKTDDHLAKWRTALTTAINKAGLSPFALGITGLESINASAESQQERNKITLETRKKKLRLWKPFIEKIMQQAVALNSWMLKNAGVKQDAFAKLDLNFDNTTIGVSFGEYIVESIQSLITNWGNAKMQGIASTREGSRNIHPEWTDEEVDKEVNEIRFEQGMSLDSPNNLPQLDGVGENNDVIG